MPIIVSLSGVFAVPIFRSCRRLGLAVSLALLTSGMLTAEVEAAAATRAATGTAAVSAAAQTTIGTRRVAAHATPRQRRPAGVVVARSPRPSRPCQSQRSGAREYREAATPLFRTAADGSTVPAIRAEAAIVYNPVTQQVLWEENAQNSRSIASITKVMTAVVFLEHALDLTTPVKIERSDVRAASTTYLRANDVLTPNDLLNLLLIGSDNAAARALARVSPFGTDGFIAKMNAKAQELGLEQTHYVDPSGLIALNVSSAYDMARLISFAAGDERIASIMRKSSEQIVTNTRTVNVHSTNKLLLGGDIDVRGGKTGFISKSGYCLATLLQVPNGDPIAVVVLGARSSAGRFLEAKHLFNWMSERTRNAAVRRRCRGGAGRAAAAARVRHRRVAKDAPCAGRPPVRVIPPSPPAGSAPAEPRDVAALRRLRTSNPDLAPAIDFQLAWLQTERRVDTRVPLPRTVGADALCAARLAAGARVLEFEDLVLDWSDVRRLCDQAADLLRRADFLEPDVEARALACLRDAAVAADRIAPLVRSGRRRGCRRRAGVDLRPAPVPDARRGGLAAATGGGRVAARDAASCVAAMPSSPRGTAAAAGWSAADAPRSGRSIRRAVRTASTRARRRDRASRSRAACIGSKRARGAAAT